MTQALDRETTHLVESVSTDRLMEDTREIARWVRLSGSPEERRAFAYIERRLREAGLRTQLLEHDALISLPQSAALRLSDPDPEEIPCITHSFAVSTPRDGIAAEAVAVREGPPAGTLSGRVAIVDGLATPDDVAKLQSDGAVGVIFLNRDPLVHEMIVSTIWGSPTLSQLGRLPSIPVVSAAGDGAARVRVRAAGGRRVRVRLTTAVQTGWRRLPLLVADLGMPEAGEVGVRVVAALAGQQYRGTRVGRSGDQSFLGIGVPSLFMSLSEHPADGPEASRDFSSTGIAAGGGLGWWWHTPEDTVDKLDPAALTRDARIYAAAAHILCASPVLPLDYAATAAEIVTSLRALEKRLGDRFDISACVAEAEHLRDAAAPVTQAARSAAGDPKDAPAVNRTLMQLGRILIPVLYTRAGRFDHDPATKIPELPPLLEASRLAEVDPDSDEAKALRVAAVRGRNRMVQALREARQLIERSGA